MSGRIEEYRGTSYNDPDEAHDAGQMRIPCMVVVMSFLSVQQKKKMSIFAYLPTSKQVFLFGRRTEYE